MYKCLDVDVISLEEMCKVLFNVKERFGKKIRKFCFVLKVIEYILKELK